MVDDVVLGTLMLSLRLLGTGLVVARSIGEMPLLLLKISSIAVPEVAEARHIEIVL